MSERAAIAPLVGSGNVPDLSRSWTERRALRSAALTAGTWILALIASIPLFSVLYMLIV
jgi:phosphate transport system permease protein